ADELLHGAAVALDLALEHGVVGAEPGPDVLGVRPFGARGETHEVHEQDRDDLPLFRGGDGRRFERRSADAAETEPLLVLLAALGTDPHALESTGVKIDPTRSSAE